MIEYKLYTKQYHYFSFNMKNGLTFGNIWKEALILDEAIFKKESYNHQEISWYKLTGNGEKVLKQSDSS